MVASSTSNSFSSRFRLKSRREFLRVQNQGRKISSRHFLFVWIDSSYDFSRVGFTVSTKVESRSSRRNRIKRLLRETLRQRIRFFVNPVDLVVIARKGSDTLNLIEVTREVTVSLQRAKILG